MFDDIRERLWWKYIRGTEISVTWPTGEIRVVQESSGLWDYVRSADPNDHYRPWLEKNVGKQGWDWDWRVRPDRVRYDDVSYGTPVSISRSSTLIIKFRKKKEKWASVALLMWG